MTDNYCVILNTCPDMSSAERIANVLVQRGFAACVNIVPGLKSIYTWKGNCETADECLLMIKTTQAMYHQVEQTVSDLHPYELPEVIAVPVEAGLTSYLRWITQQSAGS